MLANLAFLIVIPFCFTSEAHNVGRCEYRYLGNDPSQWSASRITEPAAATTATYTTYIGDRFPYRVAAIATDASGNTYVTGSRIISAPPVISISEEVFVTKLDPDGNILFTATIGGKGSDLPTALAVDAAGNIYVTGATSSPDFPMRNAIRSQFGRSLDAFLFKLGPDGSQLIYSTFIGGLQGSNAVSAIAVDGAQNVYLAGWTEASDFPQTLVLGPAPSSSSLPQIRSAFVTKIASLGGKIVYSVVIAGNAKPCSGGSSCFLGERITNGTAIGLDAGGNVYLAGNAYVTDLATAGALRSQGIGGFVAKIKAAGTGLEYLTYLGAGYFSVSLGPDPYNVIAGMAVDSAGNAYLTGATRDPNFPATPAAYQTALAGSVNGPATQPDVFVAKLAPNGSALAWASFLGGSGNESASSIAINSSGEVWVTGTTASPEFPNTNGGSSGNDFLAGFNASGSALRYAARLPNASASQAVALDPAGLIHTAGLNGIISVFDASQSPSTRVMGVANAAFGTAGGRVAPGEVISIYGSLIGPAPPARFALDASGKVASTLAGVQVSFDGLPAPLLYVSATQANTVVPFGLTGRFSSHLHLAFNGSAVDFPVIIVPAEPEIFRNADGTAAAINQDGSLNGPDHPAPPGSIVSLWATGLSTTGTDGEITTQAGPSGCCTVVSAGGPMSVEVTYSGPAPSLVAGVSQINFRVPSNILGNSAFVSLSSGGQQGAGAVVSIGRAPIGP